MVVRVRRLYSRGDEIVELSPEDAAKMIHAEEGRYLVVDATTKKVIKEIKIEDGQELLLVPRLSGG